MDEHIDKPHDQSECYQRGIERYDTNPLIRRIPPISTEPDEVDRDIANLPRVPDDNDRQKALSTRLRETNAIPRLHIPLQRDIEIAHLTEELILEGYVDRTPNPRYWSGHNDSLVRFAHAFRQKHNFAEADRATGLIGIPGVGKTRALLKCLRNIPPVIEHNFGTDPCLPLKQVVWIKIDCPHNRSAASLARKIIIAIERAVDSPSGQLNGNSDDIIIAAAASVRMHFVGLIVIDDIQNAVSKSKIPRTDIVDVLVELTNELGVPLLLVGTHKAISLLGHEMRSARKLLGPIWNRYVQDDPDWTALVGTVWKYQWNKTFTPLTAELGKTLYEKTQGVPAFLIRLIHFAQRRAILLGDEETITDSIISETYDLYFSVVDPIIRALRSNNQALMDRYDDLPKGFSIEEVLAKEAEEARKTASNTIANEMRKKVKSVIKSAQKQIALQTALAAPDRVSDTPLDDVVRDALSKNSDPLEALVKAGLLSNRVISRENAS